MKKHYKILMGLYERIENVWVKDPISSSVQVSVTRQEQEAMWHVLHHADLSRKISRAELVNQILVSCLLGVAIAACIIIAVR
ncbi:MAG: hypothetical protein DBX91_14780 [Subdoligranulum variabile]|nr:MAG: hypothetical protein DBX91_14780 [Subdoligranulum variabile]